MMRNVNNQEKAILLSDGAGEEDFSFVAPNQWTHHPGRGRLERAIHKSGHSPEELRAISEEYRTLNEEYNNRIEYLCCHMEKPDDTDEILNRMAMVVEVLNQ